MSLDLSRPLKIFIIEDDILSERLLFYFLAKSSLRIELAVSAATLKESQKKLSQNMYDLILLDLDLPDSSGLNTVSKIFEYSPMSAIVVITAGYEERLAAKALHSGAQEYLLKGDFGIRSLEQSIGYAVRRKEIEKALIDSEDKYKILVENLHDVVLRVFPDGTISYCSPVIYPFSGYSAEEVIGKKIDDFFCDQEQLKRAYKLLKNIIGEKETTLPREFFFRAKNGRTLDVEITTKTIFDEHLGVVFQCVLRDVTERNIAAKKLRKAYDDLKKTQELLVQSEKMAALGQLLSGITHDVRNPLQIILGGVEYLEIAHAEPEKEELNVVFLKIKEAVFHANKILQDMLKYACPSKLNIEWVQMCDIVKESVVLFKYQQKFKGINISVDCLDNDTALAIDRNQMEQVFLNLLLNSAESFYDGKGRIKVKLFREEKVEEGNYESCANIVMCIEDDGEGISSKDLQKLFDPFFTTKKINSPGGTGLGLFIVKMIINNYRGDIFVKSKKGVGTTFTISIPVYHGRDL